MQDISQGSGNHAFSQQVKLILIVRHCHSNDKVFSLLTHFEIPQAVRGTNPTLIPEPKRLDREECRVNLLNHVEELQVGFRILLTCFFLVVWLVVNQRYQGIFLDLPLFTGAGGSTNGGD